MSFSQAWAGVQHNSTFSGSQNPTTGALTTVTGNTIVVGVTNNAAAPGVSDVSDSKGNTFTRVETVQVSSGDHIAVYYSRNITGGTGHTVTFADDAEDFSVLTAVELESIDGTLDVSDTNTGTGTSTFTASATTTEQDDLVGYFAVSSGSNAAWNNNGSSTIRSSIGNALIGAIGGLYTRDGVAAGSNSVTGNFNDETGNYAGIFASFKVSGAGGATPRGNLLLTGVGY